MLNIPFLTCTHIADSSVYPTFPGFPRCTCLCSAVFIQIELPTQHIHAVKYDHPRVCSAMPSIACSAAAAPATADAAVDSLTF